MFWGVMVKLVSVLSWLRVAEFCLYCAYQPAISFSLLKRESSSENLELLCSTEMK